MNGMDIRITTELDPDLLYDYDDYPLCLHLDTNTQAGLNVLRLENVCVGQYLILTAPTFLQLCEVEVYGSEYICMFLA